MDLRLRSYRMKKDSALEPKAVTGTIVYDCRGHDYGLASDDTRWTGIEHISVTLDPTGAYPSFTVPRPDLDALSAATQE